MHKVFFFAIILAAIAVAFSVGHSSDALQPNRPFPPVQTPSDPKGVAKF